MALVYSNQQFISGLSTDGKPTTANLDCIFLETDTGNRNKFDGAVWSSDDNFFDSFVSTAASITTVTPGVYTQITWSGGTVLGEQWSLVSSKAKYTNPLAGRFVATVIMTLASNIVGTVVVQLMLNTGVIKAIEVPVGPTVADRRTVVLSSVIGVGVNDEISAQLTSTTIGVPVEIGYLSFTIK
jgi:hypothetical protein